MKMKKKILITSIMVILITVLAGTGVAVAKNIIESRRLDNRIASIFQDKYGKNMINDSNIPGKRGMRTNVDIGMRRNANDKRLATLLEITADELKTQLSSGKSLLDIATSKGKTLKDVVETILAPMKEHLQVNVKYGYISQADADAIYQLRSSRTEALISRPSSGKANASGSFQRGRNGGFRGNTMSGRNFTPRGIMGRGFQPGGMGRGIPQVGMRRGLPRGGVNGSQ